MSTAVLVRVSVALGLAATATLAPTADDPSDPLAPATPDRYRPALADYRPYEAPTRPPWWGAVQEVASEGPSSSAHPGHPGYRLTAPQAPASASEPDHRHHE
jgi:hypothetical protein